MATDNKILTHAKIAKEAAAMLIEESQFIKSINRNREEEFAKSIDGYKIGDTVTIKVPPVPVVTDGDVYNAEDAKLNAKEESVKLTVDIPKHVGLKFGSAEKQLSLDSFKERFLTPAVRSLATTIDAAFLKRAIISVNNMTLIGGSEVSPLAPFGRARQMMAKALASNEKRFALLSSGLTNSIVDNSGTLFNPTTEIATQYKEGYIGRARGFEFIESEHIFVFQNGTKTTGITVSGANQTGGKLVVGGLTNGDVIKAGSVFTIAGVNQVHPLTRITYGTPMQFVVLEDVTAGGATAELKIYPEIKPTLLSAVKQANALVDVSPANSASLTFVGTANQVIEQALCFQKNAFAGAFVPQAVLAGCEGYTFNTESIALRVQTGGDWVNNYEGTRIDVLCGFGTVRGNHAVRVGRALT